MERVPTLSLTNCALGQINLEPVRHPKRVIMPIHLQVGRED